MATHEDIARDARIERELSQRAAWFARHPEFAPDEDEPCECCEVGFEPCPEHEPAEFARLMAHYEAQQRRDRTWHGLRLAWAIAAGEPIYRTGGYGGPGRLTLVPPADDIPF